MIQNGDFIKINYTGKLQDGNVFDTTDKEVAIKHHLSGSDNIRPRTICVGQGMLIPGLDAAFIGKNPGPFNIIIPAEKAFGQNDPNMLKIIPTKELEQQQITPHPGLPLNIDGEYGVVRSTNSGRTVVDFNHPLAGHAVTYEVEIISVVDEPIEQIKALVEPVNLPYTSITIEEGKALIKLPQLPSQEFMTLLQERISSLTSIKTVSFEQGTAPEKKTPEKET